MQAWTYHHHNQVKEISCNQTSNHWTRLMRDMKDDNEHLPWHCCCMYMIVIVSHLPPPSHRQRLHFHHDTCECTGMSTHVAMHTYTWINFRLVCTIVHAWTLVESRLNLDCEHPHYTRLLTSINESGLTQIVANPHTNVGWSGFNQDCNSREYQLIWVQMASCALCADTCNPGSIRMNLIRH